MNVNGASSSAPKSQTTTSPASDATSALGKEDFLKLFTAQLKAQNPLNPLDGADFTAQLAQFSSLEQLTNLNSGMKNMVMFQGSLQNTLSVSLIGKQVKMDGGDFHTVQGVQFANGGATLLLDDGTTTQLGAIAEIKGGA